MDDETTTAVTTTEPTTFSKEENESTQPETTTEEIETTAATTKKVTTTKSPVKKSGLNNNPSKTENAKNSDELKNVAPQQAANSSYDTEVKVSAMKETSINPNEFTYVAKPDFESHLKGVWKKFQTLEKVKVDAPLMNEYLNYVCLPLKNSFYEVNCNGYDVQYGYDPDGTYAYLIIDWHYYVNESQYAKCKTKAQNLVGQTTGSTVERLRQIHDILGRDTAYVLNIDGPYNCFFNNKCDCDGYTAAYMICMDLLGIPCKAYSTSTHIFNCVQLNGKWYVVDVTWDDQTDSGFVYTRYFLVGSGMYSKYPILKNLLSPTDYECSRKLTVFNEEKFRKFANIPSDVSYTLKDDSTVDLSNGYTLRFS